ncbi:hypothetical protein FHX77_001308 [Bifidobacterium commune]|nr:hypothetical protein [Bifidobacterium commune]
MTAGNFGDFDRPTYALLELIALFGQKPRDFGTDGTRTKQAQPNRVPVTVTTAAEAARFVADLPCLPL